MSNAAIERLHDLDNDPAVTKQILGAAAVQALFDDPAAQQRIRKEMAVRVAAAFIDDGDEEELARLRDIVGAESVGAILRTWKQIDPELFSEVRHDN
jgi:hypothetical protein